MISSAGIPANGRFLITRKFRQLLSSARPPTRMCSRSTAIRRVRICLLSWLVSRMSVRTWSVREKGRMIYWYLRPRCAKTGKTRWPWKTLSPCRQTRQFTALCWACWVTRTWCTANTPVWRITWKKPLSVKWPIWLAMMRTKHPVCSPRAEPCAICTAISSGSVNRWNSQNISGCPLIRISGSSTHRAVTTPIWLTCPC